MANDTILMLVNWCAGHQCDPCKPKPLDLPPPADGGEWPPITSGIQVWYYMLQDHLTNNLPDGGLVLVGIGGQIFTAKASTAFGWSWGPSPISDSSWGTPYIQVGIDYFDGAGPRFVGSADTPGQIANYSTLGDAQAVGQAFNAYYFG